MRVPGFSRPWATLLWLFFSTTTCTGSAIGRRLPAHTDDPNVWGLQSGPANGHSDAGGMIYDAKRDVLVLVGTTHDNRFFPNDLSGSVDCFVATLTLPPLNKELSHPPTSSDPALGGILQVVDWWKFSATQRIKTDHQLDRCDFVTAVWGDQRDQYFAAGTMAVATNANNTAATAVHPFVLEVDVTQQTGATTANISAGPAMQVLQASINPDVPTPIYPTVNNDIIIPTAITTHGHDVYLATIHRMLVVHQASNTAKPSYRIGLGIAKFNATDLDAASALKMSWSRIYGTGIIEVKGDEVPPVMSGFFNDGPGIPAILQHEQDQLQHEINNLEAAREEFEEEALDNFRHAYTNDGVLISGLEVIETENQEDQYLLIAGSAPGVKEERQDGGNHTVLSLHPFVNERAAYMGDWDGFITKLGAKNGEVLRSLTPTSAPSSVGAPTVYRPGVSNAWSYTLKTQPRRDDFIQSICVPRVLPELWSHSEPYYPTVAYAIGTTTGRFDGDKDGGAFVLQLDLESMNINWKKQLTGMNVHGLACQVWVDVASHGATTRADNKDLLYIAGEVHGQMTVDLGGGRIVLSEGHGETDIWVAQLQANNGTFRWFHQIGTSQQDRLAKNVNNPTLSEGKGESPIGDTGSGKGALVLDRHGNAIVYGTTNGPFAMEKSDPFRDIFVLRLHLTDGSFRAIIPPPKTAPPMGSSGGTSTTAPVPPPSSGGTSSTGTPTPPVTTQAGEVADTSVDYGIVAAGLLVPIALGIVIILATTRRRPPSPHSMEMTETYPKSDMHVPFPPQEQPLPPYVEPAVLSSSPNPFEDVYTA